MTRGRKAQPAAIKEAKGNPGRRPTGAAASDDLAELAGAAPGQLIKDAKRVWEDIHGQLARLNLVRTTDRQALARYCQTVADYWNVSKRLSNEGRTYKAAKVGGGTMYRMNPLFIIQERLALRLERMEDRFGLNPRARQEIMHRLAQGGVAPPTELPMGDPAEAPSAGDLVGLLNQPTAGNA